MSTISNFHRALVDIVEKYPGLSANFVVDEGTMSPILVFSCGDIKVKCITSQSEMFSSFNNYEYWMDRFEKHLLPITRENKLNKLIGGDEQKII